MVSGWGRQGRGRAPCGSQWHSLFAPTLALPLHSGPPASWLQPTLAIPLHDLSGIELGLAGQSLRLEWAAGAGSCVLLPRDAKHCRAFLDELTGERGKREGRGVWGGRVGAEGSQQPASGSHGGDRQVMGLIPYGGF